MSAPAVRLGERHDSTWDAGAWRLDRPRLLAAGSLLAYAAGLAVLGSGAVRWLSVLVLFDVAVMSLPWRVPRHTRSIASLWAETLAYQAALLAAVAVVAAERPDWLTSLGHPGWYAVAALVGVALVVGSGIRLRLLLGGELAFLAGPDRPGHAAALASSAVVAAVCEEPLFRGVALEGDGAATAALAVLAAVAFVGRHHLPPAASERTTRRGLALQVAGAAALLGLTVASGSIYPAVLAHLLNNAPSAVLAVQRGRMGGEG